MGDKDIITNYQNLYLAYKKAKSNKRHNGNCAKFQMMTLEGLHMLKEQLENQTYRINPYNRFKIYEPKERVIESCGFKDKIVQHCLSDNILHPRLESEFIKNNYAGQIGKGTDFGRECLKKQMLKFYLHHGLDGWILKCDIRKFFYQIDHEVVKDIVDYYFQDKYTKWLNHLFIDSTDGLGLPLGNQVAQIYALLMLNGVDHMVTGELGINLYGRYMDDFYLIHHDKEYLKFCLENISEMISSLNLELNGKTQIIPFRCGIRFLGFHHYVTSGGKYIRRLPSDKKHRAMKRIRKMIRKVKSGEISIADFTQRYNAWKNHALKGNCIKLCHSIDEFINQELKSESE